MEVREELRNETDIVVSTESSNLQQQIEAINIQLDLFKENKPGNKPGTNRTELNGCNV